MIASPLIPMAGGYIDGHWCAADRGQTFPVINPATGDVLAQVARMGSDETLRAISAASRAMVHIPAIAQRREWLESIAAALIKNRDEIGRILCLEHGKPWREGKAEVDYAAGFFTYCASNIDHLKSRVLEERPRGCEWRVLYRPAGVVGLIVPWNFPIGMIAKKLSAALAAGCASIIKPASKTPLTMIALFALLEREVQLPAGWANLVPGSAGAIADALLAHSDVAVISFTGSTEVGKELIVKSAAQVKRVALELGGNAPYIVFADADLDKVVDQLMANKFRGNGQTCVCANRILVERCIAAEFSERLAIRVNALRIGNGLDDATDIGPLVDRAGYEKVRHHLTDALEKGALLVAGAVPPPLDKEWGGFFPPTVISGINRTMACWNEETFGPLVPIAEFDDESDALTKANDTEYGLASYLFTQDAARAQRFVEGLHFQHIAWNTGTGPTPEAPFGGMKQSGYGREGGIEGLFEFVDVKTSPVGI
ncbi:succinate-semialdehyde dehydrogenase [Rugosibacter aromaticivorans]|uniref:Succinate-semialdehyde dehydrogenase n=1 Tax=Rugosibacter aromaticivorans TaxID=1565605 RepID=A0A0C5J7T1_9PROT|nr:NAD-dependent succinate-semialdehyde dehydrogenase [Rugosibacter aromaticivorans]AJP47798.1 succinate-semialdehyde dehydrogenase [Rugosibacter aromaticivorans]TBR16183.1 MAG: NAD-dependent succinate-semialdehyde dehydrogenase [Rugosibacter sp.]